jgi:hypothetical protein
MPPADEPQGADLDSSIEEGAQAPSQAQASQPAGTVDEGKRSGGHHGHHHGGGQRAAENVSTLADTLGVSSDDILNQLQSPDGLDSLAASNGMSTGDSLFQGLVYDNQA